MTINVHWIDEHKTVLILDLHSGDWGWNELDAAIDKSKEMFNLVEHDVAVIVLSAPALPVGNGLPHARRAMIDQPAQVKLCVVVGGNMFTRTMNNVLMRLYPKMRIIFAASAEEAYKLVAEHGFQIDPKSADAILRKNA